MRSVVSYRNSTSNHNGDFLGYMPRPVVSYRNSTSNHNVSRPIIFLIEVVSYRNSTSNHNSCLCISEETAVVSYRNSTSNHNFERENCAPKRLYLIEILHQTTTRSASFLLIRSCILSKFYIKPQPLGIDLRIPYVVSYRNSTSNHNVGPHID